MTPEPEHRRPTDIHGTDPERTRDKVLVLAALVFLAFAAYGSAVPHYHFFADDLVLANGFTDKTAAFHWSQQGAWRMLGNATMELALACAPRAYLALTVAVHGCNAFLVWLLLRRLGVCKRTSVLIGGLLAVFPGFHEAVVWISASHNVWSTTFFLLTFLACLSASAPGRPAVGMILLAGAGAMTGDFFHDQYALAYFTLPVAAVWLQSGRWPLSLERRRLAALAAPGLGSGLYILAYLLTLKTTTTKFPAFNWHSLFSSIVYQYANFAAFDVWQHAVWVHALVNRLASPAGAGLLVLLAAGSVATAWAATRKTGVGSLPAAGLPPATLAAWAALLLGLAAIYVVAGGYSLDSRKRYAFVFLGALALGHLGRSRPSRRWIGPAALAAIVVCTLTTIALTETRTGMLVAMEQIDTAIAAGRVPAGTYIVDWDSGPLRFGPYLWTDPREQIWNQLPAAGGPPPVVPDPRNARQLARNDWERRVWWMIPLRPESQRPHQL